MPANNPLQKTVYFVRHGQSAHNVAPVFQADDVSLSGVGHDQADVVANRLTHVQFEVLIASPFTRAAQTAQHIADKTGKAIVFSDLFTEARKPAKIQGKPYTDEAAGMLWRDWQRALKAPGYLLESGENVSDLMIRSHEALSYLLDRPEQTIVVVTHGLFLRALVAQALLGDMLTPELIQPFLWQIGTENTGITVLQYKEAFEEDPAWRLWTLNDHSHFAE